MATVTLTNLFANKIFRIPDYQRGYSWGERQLSELWDDINDISKDGSGYRKHYTGTIFIERINKNNISNHDAWLSSHDFYNVVDGQQRLTTLTLLLFQLLKAETVGYDQTSTNDLYRSFVAVENLDKTSKVYKFGYLNGMDSFLKRDIFEDRTIISENDETNAYMNNLRFASEFFRLKIAELDNIARADIYARVTQLLIFDIRTVENDLDVQAVFETMNNRGKPLTTLEKLKNRLIYLVEKLQIQDESKCTLRGTINDAWGQIYMQLAKFPGNVLDEDEFLSAHLSLYRNPKESVFSENAASQKVFEMFCNRADHFNFANDENIKEPPVTFDKIQHYVLSLNHFVKYWCLVNNSQDELIKRVLILNGSKEVKILIATILSYYNNIDEDAGSDIDKVERILFRNSVPGQWVVDHRTLASWARAFYNDPAQYAEIQMIIDELLQRNVNIEDMANRFAYLFSYQRGAVGFHRWSGLKYFLFDYENNLKNEYGEKDDRVSIDNYYTTNIEHVVPQNSVNWQEVLSAHTDDFGEEDRWYAEKILKNTLGNLTILREGKNSSLGNAPWSDKKKRYETGSYNECEIARETMWNADAIHRRGKKMIEYLAKRINPQTVLTTGDIDKILYDSATYSLK